MISIKRKKRKGKRKRRRERRNQIIYRKTIHTHTVGEEENT
jgi:hypothetical protein